MKHENWKLMFWVLLVFVIAYYLGKMSERTDNWVYIGHDAEKVNSAFIGIGTY